MRNIRIILVSILYTRNVASIYLNDANIAKIQLERINFILRMRINNIAIGT